MVLSIIISSLVIHPAEREYEPPYRPLFDLLVKKGYEWNTNRRDSKPNPNENDQNVKASFLDH